MKSIRINKLSLNLATTLLSICLIVYIVFVVQALLIPLLFSLLLAVMICPLSRFFEKFKINRFFSTLLGLFIATISFSILAYVISLQVISIVSDSSMIINKVELLNQNLLEWISNQFNLSQAEVVDNGIKEVKAGVSNISKYAMNLFSSFGNIIASSVLVPIYTFFFLYYRSFFKQFFVKAFKSTPQNKVEFVLNKMYSTLQNYMVGQITVMCIVAILNTIGLYLLGIDHAWFFGLLASLLMILPYIGIAIGSIFPAIFALATMDSPLYALGIVIWFQVVQFLEGNFITPNIVGGKVSLNPMISMLAIILGGMLFGFAGFILALPMAALLKVLFDAIPQTEAFGFLLGDPGIEEKRIQLEEQEIEPIVVDEVKEDINETNEEK